MSSPRLLRAVRGGPLRSATVLALGLALAGSARSQTSGALVDPAQTWLGYMNWWPVTNGAPGYGGAGSSAWAAADLSAGFSVGIATLAPNTSLSRDVPVSNPYWWGPNGSGADTMDALFYVQNDAWAGDMVTFSGYCWSNTLVAPYTSTAFIKDLAPDYSSAAVTNVALIPGKLFSVTFPTTAGDHIQYGFETIGPDASLGNALRLGSVIVSSNPPPVSPAITNGPANVTAIAGSNAVFSVAATGTSVSYRWFKNGAALANGAGVAGATNSTLTLTGVDAASEGNYSVTVFNIVGSASASASLTVVQPTDLTVDSAASWIGYMNVFDPGMNYQFGQVWGAADLRAEFADGWLALSPNTNVYNPTNSYWVNADGSGAKIMDASFYQQCDGLAGLTLGFSGFCLTNTLPANYTATAFIKDFTPSYTLFDQKTATLASGSEFSVALETSEGDHIQWGFETIGPDAAPGGPGAGGEVLVAAFPPPLSITRASGVSALVFLAELFRSYTVQYSDSLPGEWQTLAVITGTGSMASTTDAVVAKTRYYRLQSSYRLLIQ